MKKLLIVCLLLYSISAYTQNNTTNIESLYEQNDLIKLYTKSNKSFSLNLAPGIFYPIKMYNLNSNDKNYIGFDIYSGLQYNYSENTSICLDFDLAFYKSFRWNSYILLEFGPKFFFPQNEKLKFFITPELGILFARKGSKNYEIQSLLPLCFSFEVGIQYKLSNKISYMLKIKNNMQIRPQLFGGKTEVDDFLLLNGGITYQF